MAVTIKVGAETKPILLTLRSERGFIMGGFVEQGAEHRPRALFRPTGSP